MLPPKGFEPKLTPKEVKHADWTTRGHSDIKHKKKKKKKKKNPIILFNLQFTLK